MNFFKNVFRFLTKNNSLPREKLSDYKQEALLKMGREQFKKLTEKGLGIPVVLL